MTINTGAAVTVTRLVIAAALPKRESSMKFQTTSEETIPILKEAFVTLTLERLPLKTWVSVANSTDMFILGLDVL
jgi:hypothetical protein